MVTLVAPLAIFLGAAATAALAFYAFWGQISGGVRDTFARFSSQLDIAGIRKRPEELVTTWVTIAAVVWILAVLVFHVSLLVGLLLLPISAVLAGGIYSAAVQYNLRRRTGAFLEQLEPVLRLMASGLRSGLGLQQSLNVVVNEMKDPARYEYARVLGQVNIGVSIYDALDDLANRVKTNETLMMARVIRINAQTGGDLGHVLEQLAATIKERRRMLRKIRALTAEGRAGALVLGAMPILLGLFIVSTQPQMSHGLLYTGVGHVVLLIILVLEVLGIISLQKILKVRV